MTPGEIFKHVGQVEACLCFKRPPWLLLWLVNGGAERIGRHAGHAGGRRGKPD